MEDYIEILKEDLDDNLIFFAASYVEMQIYNATYILINSSPFYYLSIMAASLFKFCNLFRKLKLNSINSFRNVA